MTSQRPSRPLILVSSLLLAALVAPAGAAHADTFGGFSADETRYLVGRDTICTPVPVAAGADADRPLAAAPSCQRADTNQVAAQKFRRGSKQQGSLAKYAASARGTSLTVRALPGTGGTTGRVVAWQASDPISRVVGVYLSPGGKLVAVEYEFRLGGRARVDVVGFALAAASAPRPGVGKEPEANRPGQSPGGTGASGTVKAPAASKELTAALGKARRLSKRKGKAAMAAFRRVLELDAESSEARYGVARILASRRQVEQAVAELSILAKSTREDAIVWLVEARFDKAFAKMRSNPGFRRATGLDRAGRPTRLYERLVGFSRTWEQPEVKCEQAQINLGFARLERTFQLRVTSRCGGYKDVTRLKGRWQLQGDRGVVLTLPNKRKADEVIQCTLQPCADGSGEDCLACGVDSDLSFTARPTRR